MVAEDPTARVGSLLAELAVLTQVDARKAIEETLQFHAARRDAGRRVGEERLFLRDASVHRALLGEPAQQRRRAALSRHRGIGPSAVLDVLAAHIVIRAGPEIRRLDVRVVQAVAPAVVALEAVKDSRDGPVVPLRQLTQSEGVRRALFPCEWRGAFLRPSGRDMDRPGRQWIAVVKML